MKSGESIMEILEAYDLFGTFSGAARAAGCSPNTVKRYVKLRENGDPIPKRRKQSPKICDKYADKISELVQESAGKIQAKRVHIKIVAMGYKGSSRTTCRAVTQAKKAFKATNVRVHRPWISEPGKWLQYDFGDGPIIDGAKTVLFVAWLAWSRYRVVIPLRDRTMPTVVAAIDTTFRHIGGVPTCVLTDNERTVTTDYVAGLGVRNRQIVDFATYYSTSIHACVPYDPATKGGVERSVGIAKADLVPTQTNLLDQYDSFEDLQRACTQFMEEVNNRVHTATEQTPISQLMLEREYLHRVPKEVYTLVLGQSRKVPDNTPMIRYQRAAYSVPYALMGERVWVRTNTKSEVVITHCGECGPEEVARHPLGLPGTIAIEDEHFPPPCPGVENRRPRATCGSEEQFLSIGPGAAGWLRAGAEAGIIHLKQRMAKLVEASQVCDRANLDRALGVAAKVGRFTIWDVMSIMTAGPLPSGDMADDDTTSCDMDAHEDASLAQGTSIWAGVGTKEVAA